MASGDIRYKRLTSGNSELDVVGGRLDLASATSLKWGFQNSNQILLNNGNSWELIKVATEPTLANTGLDLNSTALAPNTIYDIFAEYSSATAFTLVASRWGTGGDGANNASMSYATPIMTSNTAPGPVVVTEDGTATRAGWNCLDQTNSSNVDSWCSPNSAFPHTVMVNFGSGVCVNKYAIRSQNTASTKCVPKTWTFEGTNGAGVVSDASSTNGWTVLDTQTNRADPGQSAWVVAADTTTYFKFINNTSYSKYRIVITAVNDGSADYCSMGELKLVASANSLAGGSSRVRAYESTVIYNAGDRVTSGGHDWVCILQTTAGTAPAAGANWVDNGTSVSGDFAGLYRHDGVLVSDSSSTGKKRRWLGVVYTYNNNAGVVNFKDDAQYGYVSNFYNTKRKTYRAYNSTVTSYTFINTAWCESNGGTGAVRANAVSCITQTALVLMFFDNCVHSSAGSIIKSGPALNQIITPIFHSITAYPVATSQTWHMGGQGNVALYGYNFVTRLEYTTASTATCYTGFDSIDFQLKQ